jgi:histone deacetylase 8
MRKPLSDYRKLGYDCPIIEDMFSFAGIIAGSSLTAAQLISANNFKYAINWFGGWHHAKRFVHFSSQF